MVKRSILFLVCLCAAPWAARAESTEPEAPAVLTSPEPQPTSTPPKPRIVRRVSIGAVGDVLMHASVKDSATSHGFDWLFEPVADLMWQPDIMFANLESPVAPRTGKPGKAFVFNAPIATLQSLKKNGVDLVSIANNHAFDQHRKGMLETLQHLEEEGLAYVGGGPTPHAAGPRSFERSGLDIAFFAWTDLLNDKGVGNACKEPCERIAEFDLETATATIAEAAQEHDAVIVSLHWGTEYATEPTDDQIETARALAEAGATAVLGHHPHVLQPLEIHTRADGSTSLIAYSLGNFISNQSARYVHDVAPLSGGNPRDGALLRLEIVERDYGHGVKKIELGTVDYVPLWTENNTVTLKTRKERKNNIAIRVVSIDRMLSDVQARLAEIGEEVTADEQEEYVQLKKAEALYEGRRKAVTDVLGREFLRDLSRKPSPSGQTEDLGRRYPIPSP